MPGFAIVPAWTAPGSREIEDCHRIAHAHAPDHLAARPIAATLDWVTGDHYAPISSWGPEARHAARLQAEHARRGIRRSPASRPSERPRFTSPASKLSPLSCSEWRAVSSAAS